MNTNRKLIKYIIGPTSVIEAAALYVTTPEVLSHESRTILGYVYRDFLFDSAHDEGFVPSFPDYAIIKWVKDEFPRDALV